MYGIRAIVKYACTLSVESAKTEGPPIIDFLIEILKNGGSVEKKEVNRSYLRKAAAVGLLHLAKKSHYEHIISAEQFLILTRTARVNTFLYPFLVFFSKF